MTKIQDLYANKFDDLANVAFSGDYNDLINTPIDSDVAITQTNIIYVDKSGNDSTGDGTIEKPVLTIQKAADLVGAATNSTNFNDPTKRFYRVNVGSGVYSENVTFGTRPHIVLDLSSALIIGNVKAQYDQGGTFGGVFQATKLSIIGSDLRSYTASTNPRLGIDGEVQLESVGSGSSLLMLVSIINSGVSGAIRKQLGLGGGTFTGQVFLENTNVGGQIINTSGSGSITLYAHNADTSSTQAIGGVSGAVNLNVIRNVRFNGPVVVNSAHGRWFNVEFKSGQAHDFTGSSGAISVDANSAESYIANVTTKGTETLTLLDSARGIKTNNTATNYTASSATVDSHLVGINTALGLKANSSSLATVATSGDYNDLINKPTIPGNSRFARVIYVDQNAGSDSLGDGSLTKPYATISKAMTDVPTSGLGLTNAYAIQLGAGAYTEATLAMRPYVHICGLGYLASRINVTSNQITLDTSSSMFTGNSRIGFYNLSLSGSTGFNIDVSALTSSSLVVDGRGCWVNGASTFHGRPFGADYIELYGFFFFSNLTLTDIQGELDTSVVAGNLNVNCVSYTSSGTTEFDLSCSRIGGALNITSDNSRSQLMSLSASSIPSIVAAGAGITATADQISLPDVSNLTLSGGAAIAKIQPFSRKVGVPPTSSSPGLVGDYAVDSSFHYVCIATDTWIRSVVATF